MVTSGLTQTFALGLENVESLTLDKSSMALPGSWASQWWPMAAHGAVVTEILNAGDALPPLLHYASNDAWAKYFGTFSPRSVGFTNFFSSCDAATVDIAPGDRGESTALTRGIADCHTLEPFHGIDEQVVQLMAPLNFNQLVRARACVPMTS